MTTSSDPAVTSEDMTLEGMSSTYTAVVGARLRAVRQQKRLSLQAVEALSELEFKASVLGAYERGERAISVPRLRRLARLYEIPVDQLLPEDIEGQHRQRNRTADEPGGRGDSRQGKIRIDLNSLKAADGAEAEALGRFLATIQLERQDFNGQVLTIRADDLRVIGATFGLSVEGMIERLDHLQLIYKG